VDSARLAEPGLRKLGHLDRLTRLRGELARLLFQLTDKITLNKEAKKPLF
jgi:hypothetical protein